MRAVTVLRAARSSSRSPARKRARLDAALVQRGLAPSREMAQSWILSGRVRVNGLVVGKPSAPVESTVDIEVDKPQRTYVGRGAYKLIGALERWQLAVAGAAALDVGASTGGFTEVLLQRGARLVFAVDVGRGQLDQRLRTDPRVVVMERTNARYLTALPDPVDIAVADLSFISLRLVLPAVFGLLTPQAPIVTLVKPQFEAGKGQVGRGGIVRDPGVHEAVLNGLAAWSDAQPWRLAEVIPSPIKGTEGNSEFLGLWHRRAERVSERTIAGIVRATGESTEEPGVEPPRKTFGTG